LLIKIYRDPLVVATVLIGHECGEHALVLLCDYFHYAIALFFR
jgi:hypothetical protein